MQSTSLGDTQSVNVQCLPLDSQGAPAVILATAAPTPSTSSDPTIATVTDVDASNLTCVALKPGIVTITKTGTRPDGAQRSTSFTLTVTGGPLESFNFVFGTPFTTATPPPTPVP